MMKSTEQFLKILKQRTGYIIETVLYKLVSKFQNRVQWNLDLKHLDIMKS